LVNQELDKYMKELILRLGLCGFWAHACGLGSSAIVMAVIYIVNTITELANCP